MTEHEREIALSVAYEMWSAGVVYIGPSSVQLLLFADRFLNRIRSDQIGSNQPPSVPEKLPVDGMYGKQHHYAEGWNDCIDAMAEPKPGEPK